MRIALAFLVSGCVAMPSNDSEPGSGSGSGSAVPPSPAASGIYQVRSDIDLTVEALLPEPAEEVVVTLRDFSTNPAHTLIDLADQAGVPAVQEIRDALPDYLEGKLEGWINDEIAKVTINGVPVTTAAGEVAALAETALSQFALDSTLDIGTDHATHTLKTLDLTPSGLNARFALDALPADVISATPTCSSNNGTLTLGDHSYGLPYGEYVWTALNAASTAKYGADLRTALGTAVNCPAIAHSVASMCYWGVCVGHEAQLTEICERGLDEVVNRAHAKLSAIRFDAIHFQQGVATVATDALNSGVWTAEINAGMGLRPVPATFTATR